MGDPEENEPHRDDAPRQGDARAPVNPQATPHHQTPDSFWTRINRHKVVEWTLAYVAFGYALLHGVEIVSHAFEWPPLVARLTVYILLLGTPLAATLAWYHGHRARQWVSGPELTILILLLVVAGSILWLISGLGHEHAGPATKAVASRAAVAATPPAAPFNRPPHSIAVLPFVNMSGDPGQEYFSEGLTEELLNSLAEISELQVAARTSAFSFKGKDADIGTIARKLNVASVLEGSVRRSGNTVRVTAQLVNAATGFQLWSHTYDRDLGDVLKLESDIAGAVASALKVSLLGGVATKIELGGTRNPAAFDAYLQGRKADLTAAHTHEGRQTAIAAYTEAIGLDSNYALAFAYRALARINLANAASGPARRESLEEAQSDARQAIALTPDLAEGRLALAVYFRSLLDFARASQEFERALALGPGNVRVLQNYGLFAVQMGRTEAGTAALRRAVVLDPLSFVSHWTLGRTLYYGRQNKEASTAFEDAFALDPEDPLGHAYRGLAYYALGDFERARASCEMTPDDWGNLWCLAVTYDKLGRHADAEAVLAKYRATEGDAGSYQYATIYAQWGNTVKALEGLDTARRLRDPGLTTLKTDPLLDPVRKEPRFQAIERALKFPSH